MYTCNNGTWGAVSGGGLPAGCTSSGTGIITCSGAVTGNPLLSGTPTAGAQAALPAGAHGVALDESSTAGVPASGVDYIRADSVTHQLVFSQNNGAETTIATASGTWAVTAPAVTCYGGTPTTVTAALSTGTDGGKTRFLSVTISVTNVGTCASPGAYTTTLPFTPQTGATLNCRENAVSGNAGQGEIQAGSTALYVAPNAGSGGNWAVSGYSVVCSGVVQAQ
jgi:hypothetical protein